MTRRSLSSVIALAQERVSSVATPMARILIIEDNRDLQESLQMALQEEGYEVIAAYDGLEGLDQIRAAAPDLILLDLMMPRMDGFEFADQLQGWPGACDIPIIVLTAAGGARQAAEKIGASGFIPKPFDLPDLLDEITRLTPPPESSPPPEGSPPPESSPPPEGSPPGSDPPESNPPGSDPAAPL